MYFMKDGKTLVNISSSILRHYGVTPFHKTYKPLDRILNKNKNRKVVLFLFDGLGMSIIEKNQKSCPYIASHIKKTISSVFPPTTVAATTSILSGLYPAETGWLGWWTRMNGEIATTFTGAKVFGEGYCKRSFWDTIPYTTIVDLINRKSGTHKAESILVLDHDKKDLTHLTREVLQSLVSRDFVYAYWPDPDFSIHVTGTESKRTRSTIENIDNKLKKFAEDNPDVLIISTADHSLIDRKKVKIHKDFFALASNSYSIEPAAASFVIKEENRKEFERLFKLYYSKSFKMFSKDQVIKRRLFGPMDYESVIFRDLIGDYLVVSISDYYFADVMEITDNIGVHGGGTKKEFMIPLCIYNE